MRESRFFLDFPSSQIERQGIWLDWEAFGVHSLFWRGPGSVAVSLPRSISRVGEAEVVRLQGGWL